MIQSSLSGSRRFVAGLTVALLVGSVALPISVHAHDYRKGDLQVSHPWTRVNPKGSTMGAGFMTVVNKGKADRLVAVRMDGVTTVTLHETQKTPNGMLRMVAVPGGFVVPAGGTLALQPGGAHLMLEGLQQELTAGGQVSATLVFDRAGAVPVAFKVEPLGAAGPAHDAAHSPGAVDKAQTPAVKAMPLEHHH